MQKAEMQRCRDEEERSDKVSTFERLHVFQRAYRLSLAIHHVSKKFPKDEQFGLADQLRRSSKSVCANIVEGCAKQFHSRAEFRRFVAIAIGSADEARLWCRYSHDLGFIPQSLWDQWRQEYLEIVRMLSALHRNLKP